MSDDGVVGAVGVTAIAAVPFVVALVSAVTGGHPGIPGQLATVAATFAAAALAWRAGARWTGRADVARAWRAAAVGVGAWSVAAGLWWAARTTAVVSPPIDTAATVASIAFYPLAAWALVHLAERGRTGSEQLRFAVDTVSVGVAAFIGLLVVRVMSVDPGPATLGVIATAGGVAVIIAAAVGALLHRPAGDRSAPAILLGCGSVVLALAIPGFGALPADAATGFHDVGTLLGVTGGALVAWAAALQAVDRRVLERAGRPTDHLGAMAGFLPIAAAGAAFAAILGSEAEHLAPATIGLVGCGVALVALAGLRQAVAVRDSRDARRSARLVASQARFRSVVENASDVIVTVAPSGRIASATPSLARITGWSPEESVGVTFLDRVHSDDRGRVARIMDSRRPARAEPSVFEFRMLRPDDEWVDVEAALVDLRDDPSVCANVLTIRDIGERKVFESGLRRQAFQDPLTGLPNRSHFVDRIEQAFARTARTAEPIQVLYLDLDGFKRINDSLGHDAGDRVLRVVAERLTWAVRVGDTPARLGGDEFAVLLEDGASVDVARAVAERIQSMVSAPIEVEGRQVRVGVSVGVASPATISGGTLEEEGHVATRAQVADELIRNADVAMYEAKQRGKGRVSIYEPAMRLAAVTRLDLEQALREAVERDEFRVHFQPIVNLATGGVVAMEALARWERPGAGLVGPATFIAVAEETGLIRPIGASVIRRAFADAARWAGGRTPVDLCVNLSARQLLDPLVLEAVEEALRTSGLDARRVVFEITESSLIEEGQATLDQLARLRAIGIRLAIDDFGTGYSSLGYLEQLPVDILKIDRAFIVDLPTSPKRATLLRAIVGMAGALHLTTIAEGIETDEQLHAVRAIGCDLAQGFLISQPMDAHDAAVLVEAAAADPRLFRGLLRAADISGRAHDAAHQLTA
ncbi:MAG: EAL domain-containing protein [Chloroflexi bacterium]|nr:EAL domain-containing protein [Chloroflexota bacterium]